MLSSFFGACIPAKDFEMAWQQALSLLVDACPRWGLVPTTEHFGLVMQSLRGPDSWQIASELLAEMKLLGLQYSIQSYDGATHAFATRFLVASTRFSTSTAKSPMYHPTQLKKQSPQRMAQAVESKGRVTVPHRLVAKSGSYVAAIGNCGQRSEWRNAVSLLREFQERRCRYDIFIYSSAISACSEEWQVALFLLQELQMHQLEGNVVTYGAAIGACEKTSQWQSAIVLLSDLCEKQMESNVLLSMQSVEATFQEISNRTH
eukprot:symbB.v1.2.004153.t1/scaffold235.1/size321457/12